MSSSAFSISFTSLEDSCVGVAVVGTIALLARKNLSLEICIGPVVPILSAFIFFFFSLNLPTLPLTLLNSPTSNSSSSEESFLSKLLDATNLSFKRET